MTLLKRGQWCCAMSTAISIGEQGISDIAEMLMCGVRPYSQMTEEDVMTELKEGLGKDSESLTPYTLQELVEEAEEMLEIEN